MSTLKRNPRKEKGKDQLRTRLSGKQQKAFRDTVISQTKALGLKRKHLAAMMGIHQGTLSQFLSGVRDPSPHLLEFAKHLRVSICELLNLYDRETIIIMKHVENLTREQKQALIHHILTKTNLSE